MSVRDLERRKVIMLSDDREIKIKRPGNISWIARVPLSDLNPFKMTRNKIFYLQESVNLTADRLNWEREINRQLVEERERHAANKVKALQQYEEDLQAWKEMHSQYLFYGLTFSPPKIRQKRWTICLNR